MAFDLNEAWGWIQKLIRRMERIESGAMLENSSITNGRMRFIGGLLRVDSGGRVDIEGTLKGIGSLLWDGIVTFTSTFTAKGITRFEGDTTQVGPFHVSGATDVTGNFTAKGTTKLEGPAEVTGTLAVKGVTTLTNDLNVTTGGKIVAGATIFNPTGILSSSAALTLLGSTGINLSGSTTIGGTCTLSSTAVATGAANAFLTAAGAVQKVGSARRFKIDPVPLDVPDALLDVPVREWIDMGNAERFAALYNAPRPLTQTQQADYDGVDLSRIPGVIAEEVEAAGGQQFVTYNEAGVIEGVAYDRVALARTQILAERLAASNARSDALEARIQALEACLAA